MHTLSKKDYYIVHRLNQKCDQQFASKLKHNIHGQQSRYSSCLIGRPRLSSMTFTTSIKFHESISGR